MKTWSLRTFHDTFDKEKCPKKDPTDHKEFCSMNLEEDLVGAVKCFQETGAPIWQNHHFTNKNGVIRPLKVLSGIVSRYVKSRQ